MTQELEMNYIILSLVLWACLLDVYIMRLVINCENNFEIFRGINIEFIKSIDISGFRLIAFYVLCSIGGCRESKEKGLMNLQSVLSWVTILKELLEQAGVMFDI